MNEHTEQELQAFFEQISERLEQQRIVVHLRGRIVDEESNLNGFFVPRNDNSQWLGDASVYRERAGDPGDAMVELLTLAHEAGHALSYLRGFTTDEYRAAADQVQDDGARLPAELKTLVLEEEARAWILGKEELAAIGFRQWSDYDAEVARALGIYGTKLGIVVSLSTLLDEQQARLASSA